MSIEKINAAREQIASTSAYKTLTEFFDEGSFCELDAFVKSGDGLAEVTAGSGTVEGMSVYAFAQNSDISGGALSSAQSRKLKKLYSLALKTGAPVFGFYSSIGGRLKEGTDLLGGCGEVLKLASKASGVVPQVSVVIGDCLGTNALSAVSADFVIMSEKAQLSLDVTGKNAGLDFNFSHGNVAIKAEDSADAVAQARNLVPYLPSNNLVPAAEAEANEPDGLSGKCIVSKLVDGGTKLRLFEGFGVKAVDVLHTVSELRCDRCPRLELKITLHQKVVQVVVIDLVDAPFCFRKQCIILRLHIADLLFQRHDLEHRAVDLVRIGRCRPRHIVDATAVHTLRPLPQQVDFVYFTVDAAAESFRLLPVFFHANSSLVIFISLSPFISDMKSNHCDRRNYSHSSVVMISCDCSASR